MIPTTDPRFIQVCAACKSPGHCTEFRTCVITRETIPARTWKELQQLPQKAGSFNSRIEAIVHRLESVYDFQCEAGPISLCVEWQELKVLLGCKA